MKNQVEPIANKYYYAYDPKLDRRVVHVFHNGHLVSLLSGHKFKFDPDKE